jgi:putative alpha-1,2-mannosidase
MRPYREHAVTLAALALMTTCTTTVPADTAPIEWVDPLIGTGGHMYGVGGDPPGAQVPFGLVKFSPDTTPVADSLWLDFEHYGGANYEGAWRHL